MSLSDTEIERYSRQLVLRDWSTARQQSLREASCLVDGSLEVAARYLVAVGIGTTTLEGEVRAGFLEELRALNPDVHVDLATLSTELPKTFHIVKNETLPVDNSRAGFALGRKQLLHGTAKNPKQRILSELEQDSFGTLSQSLLTAILLTQYC